MRFILFLLVAGTLYSESVTAQQAQPLTTFILIRHAEKADDGTKDPVLSEQGNERAKRLVSLFKDTPIDVVYATNYQRTKATAKPLAEAKAVDVNTYEPKQASAIDDILKKHTGKTIVLVGHSNTVPWIANYLTGTNRYTDFPEDDFDNVIVVTVAEKGKTATSIWLNY